MNVITEFAIWYPLGFAMAATCWLVGVKFQAIVSALTTGMSD